MTSVGRILHRFRDEAVYRVGFVGGAFKQALEEHGRQAAGTTLGSVGVHRVKGAETPDRNFAAFRRVGVYIVEMREVRWIFQLAKGRDAVGGDCVCPCIAGQRRNDESGKSDRAGGRQHGCH